MATRVDFDEVIARNATYREFEAERKRPSLPPGRRCPSMANMQMTKTPMPEQDPQVRNANFLEVAQGYTLEQAMNEAQRCIHCKTRLRQRLPRGHPHP